jgi:Family of unknown function (DUF5519)
MKLAEKGRFAPPPELPKHAQAVAEALARWPRVHARTHWLLGDETEVDGADFYLGDDELGHLHLDGEAHIAVGAKLRAALIAGGLAKPFRWSAAFVVFRIVNAKGAAHAKRLFQLSYDRRAGVPEQVLLGSLQTRGPRDRAERAARLPE